jgi:hypothetical protein
MCHSYLARNCQDHGFLTDLISLSLKLSFNDDGETAFNPSNMLLFICNSKLEIE